MSRLLRFSDSMMQSEFVTYMRSEVFSQSCIILIFLFVLSLSVFALLSMSDADESTKLLLQIVCIELRITDNGSKRKIHRKHVTRRIKQFLTNTMVVILTRRNTFERLSK